MRRCKQPNCDGTLRCAHSHLAPDGFTTRRLICRTCGAISASIEFTPSADVTDIIRWTKTGALITEIAEGAMRSAARTFSKRLGVLKAQRERLAEQAELAKAEAAERRRSEGMARRVAALRAAVEARAAQRRSHRCAQCDFASIASQRCAFGFPEAFTGEAADCNNFVAARSASEAPPEPVTCAAA